MKKVLFILLLLVFNFSFAQSEDFMNEKIDKESKVALDALLNAVPGGFNSIKDVVERRNFTNELFKSMMGSEINPNVIISDYKVPGLNDAPEIKLRVYTPKNTLKTNPGIYYIHGGGMIIGSIQGEEGNAIALALELNAIVVSVEYRLAPENPYPAAVEDCYSGLIWMAKNSKKLKIDSERIAIYGGSAGGGLTIATSMMARDNNFPKVCFQMPLYPMIDDRNISFSSHQITNVGIWDREANIEAWNWYLGGKEANEYAAPARAKYLNNLPPTFIDVGDADLFRDEDIQFVKNLIQAGVETEFHLYPGAFHGSEILAPEATLSKKIWKTRYDALNKALYP